MSEPANGLVWRHLLLSKGDKKKYKILLVVMWVTAGQVDFAKIHDNTLHTPLPLREAATPQPQPLFSFGRPI